MDQGRLKALLDQASPKAGSGGVGFSVHGRGAIGVMGDNNNVTIMNGIPAPAVAVPIRPGVDHITDEQAARIQELVGIVAGRGRRSFGSVYGDLFRHLGGGRSLVPRYRLIPLEMYPKAERFLTELAESLRG